MATSKLIVCTLFIIVTLILLGYYSNKNNNIRITSESHNIPFVIWPFQQDLVTKQSLYTPYTISPDHYVAAIIEGKSTEDVQEVVNYLSKYPYIQEIYVYNRTGISLGDNNKRLNIKESMGKTKFETCVDSRLNRCYFQDNTWLNPYMDSLYTHAIRHPDQWIVNTKLSDTINAMTWRFRTENIHAGYADLRYGAFVSKDQVQHFLDNSAFDHTNDVHFAIGLGQYPYIISNPITTTGNSQLEMIGDSEDREQVADQVYDALLLLDKSSTQREDNGEVQVMDVKSSCMNDQCLFITSIDIIPPIPPVTFDFQYANMISYESVFNKQVHLPAKNTILYHSYHKAVDLDTETCWYSYRAPKKDDYFGLYMVGDMQAKRITLYTSETLDSNDLQVHVQHELYGSWQECSIHRFSQLSYGIKIDIDCARPIVKSIRFVFTRDLHQSFELCSIALDNFFI